MVFEVPGVPYRLGLACALWFASLLSLALVTRVVMARFLERGLVADTQLALMAPAFTLAVLAWTRTVQYWHVAALAVAIGVVNALDMPGRQSFIAEMVGRDDLLNAIALNSAVFNAARVIGPAVGGLLT